MNYKDKFKPENIRIAATYSNPNAARIYGNYCATIGAYNALFSVGQCEDLNSLDVLLCEISYLENELFSAELATRKRLRELIFETDRYAKKASRPTKSLFELEQEYLILEYVRQKNSETKSSLFIELVIDMANRLLAQQSGNIYGFKF